jgi:ketosteroid isomerase-like protein
VYGDTLAAVLETFARGTLDGVAERFAENGTYREARKPPIHGRVAIAAEFARFATAGIPFRFEVDDVLASGDRACVVYRFAAPEGTGEPWRERAGCATVRFDQQGRIAEWREYEG